MARIRTIKPEFYSSPGIESLEFAWRILYIAMWNWADDTGRGTAEARELMGFAFPLDEDMTLGEFRRGLGEVRRVFGVTFYKVDGRSYYAIPAWDKHQKIDKRSGSKWPGPDDGLLYDPATNSAPIQGSVQHSAETHESPPSVRRDMGAGTGEQGNRGTGEQRVGRKPATTGTKLPHDWKTTAEHIAWALEHCPNIDAKLSTQKFKSHYKSVAGPQQFKTDWDEAWKSWLISDQAKATSGQPLTASERRLQQGKQIVQRAANRQAPAQNPFEGKELTR